MELTNGTYRLLTLNEFTDLLYNYKCVKSVSDKVVLTYSRNVKVLAGEISLGQRVIQENYSSTNRNELLSARVQVDEPFKLGRLADERVDSFRVDDIIYQQYNLNAYHYAIELIEVVEIPDKPKQISSEIVLCI